MAHVQSRLSKFAGRTFQTSGLVILIVVLVLPFTRAFADDRYGRGGPVFYGGVSVQGWRLGGAYRTGGYEIWHRYRGDWRRMPGRGVQLGGNPRNPWVINSQGERYQWTGRDWRFVGYANGRGFSRRNTPPPAFRNDRGWDRWYDNWGNRNDRYYDRRDNRRGVVRQQRNRIERQQDRIRDLRRDLRRERVEDRRDDRRDRVRDRREDRRDRVQDRREDRRDQDRRGDDRADRQDRPGSNSRPDRDGGPRNGPR
jgi:hypothetical protein